MADARKVTRTPTVELRGLQGPKDEVKAPFRGGELPKDVMVVLEEGMHGAVIDGADDAVFIHDGETAEILGANRKVCDLFGCTEAELQKDMGDKSAGFSPYTGEDACRWVRKAATEGPKFFEWRAKRRNGGLFWAEVNLKPAFAGGRSVVLAVIRDITERKQVEAELRATKDYLKTVFHSVHDAIFIHDFKGKVIDVNRKMLEMYDLDHEEAVDSYIARDYSAPGNPLGRLPSLWKKVMAGQDQFFEWKARRPKDGSIFDVEVFLTRLSLPKGNFILANVRDITERKRVEQELRATKDYLKTVYNNVYDAIFIHDFNGKVVDVNDKMMEMYRVGREEAVTLSIIPDYSIPDYFVDKKLATWAVNNWKKAMAGENQFFEWKARRPKDGSVFDVEVFLTKLSLSDGDFILANVRDITERKKMEKMLIREKGVFFSVMKNNPHGIALFDNEGRFDYFNPEFTAITGYTLDDVPTGRDWVRKAYPDRALRTKVVEFWKGDRLTEGRGRDVEWKTTCRNGEMKDVEYRVTYLGDKSLVVLTDTTARKRAEEELRAEKQKFQTLSESSPVGMVMVGADENIKYVNPKFTELFGYGPGEIPSITEWFKLAYPDPFYCRQARKKWDDDWKSLELGEGRPYIRTVYCRDGAAKHVNFIPVQLETGEILITCEDITMYKEAEDKIRERNLELEVLNDITASVSGSLNMREIAYTLKRVFVEKLGISTGGVFFYDEHSDRLGMETCWGVPEAVKDDFEAFVLTGYRAGTFIRENEVILEKSDVDCLRTTGFSFSKYTGTWRSYLSIPLVAKGETQGVIFLVNGETDTFSDDQIPFFRTLGQQIGVAAQNARLFEQVQQSHAEMKALSLRLVRVQEAELRHVARELHDEIGQSLTGLRLALEMALRSPAGRKAGLMKAKSLADTLKGLVGELSRNLRPSMLDDLGLLRALPWLFERFSAQTDVRVLFEHSRIDNKRFPLEVETAIYRITQEALTNVARHAGVSSATVRLWSNDETIGAQIEDRGNGFDLQHTLKEGGSNGLTGMRERVVLLGGQFTVETAPGSGTRLTAELPAHTDEEVAGP